MTPRTLSRWELAKHFILGGTLAGASGGSILAVGGAASALALESHTIPNQSANGIAVYVIALLPFAVFGVAIGVVVGAFIGLFAAILAQRRSRRFMSAGSSIGVGIFVCICYPTLLVLAWFLGPFDLPWSELMDGVIGVPAAIVGGIVAGKVGWRYLSRRVGPALEHIRHT